MLLLFLRLHYVGSIIEQDRERQEGEVKILLNRKTTKFLKGQVVTRAILLAVCIPFLLPFFWMLSTALKNLPQTMAFPPVWIPDPIVWDNFREAIQTIPFFTYFKNTAFYVTFSIVGTLISCPFVAYGLSMVRWPARDSLLLLILATMMIPFPVTMVPLFIIFGKLGWINTYAPLIVPTFFGTPFFIFLLRQFFMTIPPALPDAARIDGASELTIFARVILPLCKPALGVVALFQFLASWNNFMGPLIYLMEESKYPLSLGLQDYRSTYFVEWNLFMAASTIVVVPTVIIFFIFQRRLIEGIHLTGVKE